MANADATETDGRWHLQLYSTGLSPAQRALTGVASINSVRAAVLESVAASGDPAVAVVP